MTAGEWFIQIYRDGSGKPEPEIYFADFSSMLAYVKRFKARKTQDILRAHVPAHAEDYERQQLIEVGAILS